jgi:D-alanyl-D-alanine carboxypeptidase
VLPASLRRTLASVVLLLATLVFFVPAATRAGASSPGDALVYGPELPPVNRIGPLYDAMATTALHDAPLAPRLRDAYVAPPPGVALPDVTSRAYAVVERGCGAVVLGSNVHERLPPASVTKVLTALVTLQRVAPDAMVDVDVDYEWPYFEDSSLMGLKPGMRLSVQDLLYGLMLPSGNDAAEALARYVGGGDPGAFIKMMNDTAAALGMSDTSFSNPSGLDQEGLYSTAWDLALMTKVALDNEFMMRLSTTLTYRPRWDGPSLKNGNALLKSYPGAFGLKIGFTDAAKETIVAAAERNGRQLIVSLLGSDDRYGDTRALLDWTFKNTRPAC